MPIPAALLAAALLGPGAQAAVAPPPPVATIAIIPQPVRLMPRAGAFRITKRTVMWTDVASEAVARQLARYLEPATGLTLRVQVGGTLPAGAIAFHRERALRRLGAEGYRLDVTPSHVVVRAPEPAGVFYGSRRSGSCCRPRSSARRRSTGSSGRCRRVTIEDQPRFGWRGAHLDVGRHFMPKEFVKKYIDLLALHKLNIFHWHLTEDQGWRIEIAQVPAAHRGGRLARTRRSCGRHIGTRPSAVAVRRDAARRLLHAGRRAEIVAYAGRASSTWCPRSRCPGTRRRRSRRTRSSATPASSLTRRDDWGVFADVLNVDATHVAFLQDVLDEVLALFPSRYIHVGGDEADKAKWKASRRSPGADQGARRRRRTRAAELVRPPDGRLSHGTGGGWSAGTRSSRAAWRRTRS